MKEPEGRDVVFWSGGLDSTLVTLDLLRSNKFVNLVTVIQDQIGSTEQQTKERFVRKKLLTKLRSEFGNKFEHEEFMWDGAARLGYLGQACMWLSTAPLTLLDKDKLYFGFIRYSDFWHWKNEFETAFDALCKFHGKECTLIYPLEYFYKRTIAKKLKKLGYLDFCYHSVDKVDKK